MVRSKLEINARHSRPLRAASIDKPKRAGPGRAEQTRWFCLKSGVVLPVTDHLVPIVFTKAATLSNLPSVMKQEFPN